MKCIIETIEFGAQEIPYVEEFEEIEAPGLYALPNIPVAVSVMPCTEYGADCLKAEYGDSVMFFYSNQLYTAIHTGYNVLIKGE